MTRTLVAGVALMVLSCMAARAEDAWKNPLARAKVGQWVEYKMPNEMGMKQSITKVDGKKVTIKTETTMNGSVVSSSEAVVDLEAKPAGEAAAPAAPAPKVEVAEETLEVAGKKLKCRVTSVGEAKTWMSEDVPVNGLVKTRTGEMVAMELVGWGEDAAGGGAPNAGGADAPNAGGGADAPNAGGAGAAPAGGHSASQAGVTVQAADEGPMKTDSGTPVKGFHVFKVTAKNENKEKKTLKGELKLIGAGGAAAGSCTIYLELPPGETVEKVLNCKEVGAWEKYEVVIEKIFNF